MLCRALAIVCAVAWVAGLMGCASPGPAETGIGRIDPVTGLLVPPDSAEIEAIVEGLNKSIKQNKIARGQLMQIGEPALPALVAALDLDSSWRSRKARIERATRVLRVLRLMGSPAGVDMCRRILLGDEVDGGNPEQWALLTEALAYLCENFSDPDVRDDYLRFLYDHQDRYMGKMYIKRHWHGGMNKDVFRVDVTYGVSYLVQADDFRVKDVLTYLLGVVTRPSYGGSYVWRLAGNGYSSEQEMDNRSGRAPWPQSLADALQPRE